MVAAGHVTTQTLGGKKICWAGGVAEVFDRYCDRFCGFRNPRAVGKICPLYHKVYAQAQARGSKFLCFCACAYACVCAATT